MRQAISMKQTSQLHRRPIHHFTVLAVTIWVIIGLFKPQPASACHSTGAEYYTCTTYAEAMADCMYYKETYLPWFNCITDFDHQAVALSYQTQDITQVNGNWGYEKECDNGNTQSCTIGSCSGTQTCSSGHWGACQSANPCCGSSDPCCGSCDLCCALSKGGAGSGSSAKDATAGE